MSRLFFPSAVLFFLVANPSSLLAQRRSDEIRFTSGNIQVRHGMERLDQNIMANHMILRDQINFGQCFEDTKYRRMPVTYYHPQGPLGLAFRKFNWFPGGANTYHADARFPASLAALSCSAGSANVPLLQLASLWSEPPVAVIGLSAGTPAAYARPFQHFHFYEPNKEVIELNERKDKRFFHFIPDARARGASVQIFQGSPRQQLAKQGPRKFYHLMILEACSGENGEKIHLDLFTKEGIAQCMELLTDDGILCVHTSHRFLNLPPVLAAIGKDLKLQVRRGLDSAPGNLRDGSKVELAEIGHFSSEWVLLSRHQPPLDAVCKNPPNYMEMLKKRPFGGSEEYWSTPMPLPQVWTDKGPNLLHDVLRGHPFAMRYSAGVQPCADAIVDLLRYFPATAKMQRSVADFSNLPRPVEDWMVRYQLRNYPQVEKLWR